jgi:mRNA-degrading endonuclease toxin of MazEF toxin-antitoxin module
MISYDFGDIVLVPFPFTDQSGIKKRPAVIVSSAPYNAARLDLILMAVTSQIVDGVRGGSDYRMAKGRAVEVIGYQACDGYGREATHHSSTRTT